MRTEEPSRIHGGVSGGTQPGCCASATSDPQAHHSLDDRRLRVFSEIAIDGEIDPRGRARLEYDAHIEVGVASGAVTVVCATVRALQTIRGRGQSQLATLAFPITTTVPSSFSIQAKAPSRAGSPSSGPVTTPFTVR
jgi:hypothetical protein